MTQGPEDIQWPDGEGGGMDVMLVTIFVFLFVVYVTGFANLMHLVVGMVAFGG